MTSSAATAPRGREGSHPPVLRVENGTLEALKWIGLVLMTVDHVNKYLLHDAWPALFDAGRLALPLFSFVLAHHLARPESRASGVHGRVARRLAIAGLAASIPFIGLGGLVWEWWPLNIMFMLLLSTGVIALLDQGGALRVLAAAMLLLAGGAMVEFWWPAVVMTIAAWRYMRRPTWSSLIVWVTATASLYAINRNLWALAALPLIAWAPRVSIAVPRMRGVFYVFYPLHLWVLWILTKL
jgi:hypothetical protein